MLLRQNCLLDNSLQVQTSAATVAGSTDMRRLTTGTHSEKCVVKRFSCCANVIECKYTNVDSMACYTPRLYGTAYCS